MWFCVDRYTFEISTAEGAELMDKVRDSERNGVAVMVDLGDGQTLRIPGGSLVALLNDRPDGLIALD
ncbi:hypothetical protein G7075_00165 [Phycicoccus sp. HDW14]|uniref:hypothetical protein n=1 Tax=Phycicoccus sp. HDW14 TaxID=2714941 RepID=UPI00140DE645|nr:hypothetical protein [Phycicoccus sp. HDW14]QIM19910.1 hypothetical protein G7075_00165 [Phycicoccus sp. HDW14]